MKHTIDSTFENLTSWMPVPNLTRDDLSLLHRCECIVKVSKYHTPPLTYVESSYPANDSFILQGRKTISWPTSLLLDVKGHLLLPRPSYLSKLVKSEASTALFDLIIP